MTHATNDATISAHSAGVPPEAGAGLLQARILEAVRDHAIFALTRQGCLSTWTPAAREMTGYSEAEVLGQPITLLSAEKSEADLARLLQTVRESGCAGRERWWRRRNGTLVWVDEQIQTLDDGFVVIARDLTARAEAEERRLAAIADDDERENSPSDDVAERQRARRAREAEGVEREAAGRAREVEGDRRERLLRSELQSAERRAAFLAEASSILVATSLDFDSTLRALTRLAVSRIADWCVIHAIDESGNATLAEVAHRDPRAEPLLHSTVSGFLNDAWEQSVNSVVSTGQSQILGRIRPTTWFAPKDAAHEQELQAIGTGSAMITPLMGRGRVLGAVTLVATDDDREYDEEDLVLAEELGRRAAIALDNARLYRDAQEANRAKADFLAVMSHELRTPLNAIMGYSDLLDAQVSGDLTDKQRRQIDRIRASARHLLQLIEEILSYARMESGGEEVHLDITDVRELLDDAAAVIEPMATSKGLDFRIEMEGDATIETDAGKARQVLVNLLSNSIKFTEHGHVTLRFRVEGQQALFDVEDTGIGIPQEQIERIFDPFWQVERPNTRRAGGTGLGLSVSRRYVRLLRGDIVVRSEVGRGTRITVTLPLRITGARERD